ncbi:hypothetical protein KEM52_006443, partial [Ascosphaera acerosa]
ISPAPAHIKQQRYRQHHHLVVPIRLVAQKVQIVSLFVLSRYRASQPASQPQTAFLDTAFLYGVETHPASMDPAAARSMPSGSAHKRVPDRLEPVPPLRTPLSIVRPNRADSFGSSFAGSPVSSAGSSPTSGSRAIFMNPIIRSGSRSRSGSGSGSASGWRSHCRRTSRIVSPASSKFSGHTIASLVLRRKPSQVDVAMCEERERCCEDEIERRGLALMEPRPIDLEPTYFASSISMSTVASSSMETLDPGVNIDALLDYGGGDDRIHDALSPAKSSRRPVRVPRSPPCVMGGIFETLFEEQRT